MTGDKEDSTGSLTSATVPPMRGALITLVFLLAIGLLIWLASTVGTPATLVAASGRGGSGESTTGTQAVTLVPKPGERSEYKSLPRGRVADIEQLVQSLPPGTLVVAVPEEARLGAPVEVHAILVPDVPAIRDFAVASHPQRRRAGEALAVTNLYRATLETRGLASNGPLQRDVRWRSEGPVVWTWTLTSQQEGKFTLQFAFEIQTELDGQTEMRRIRAMGREIAITNPLMPRIMAAMAGRWWIGGLALAFLLAGAALVFLLPRKRRATAKS